MPGPFDAEAGVGTFAGVDKFQALAGVDLRGALADRLGVAPGAVRFVNDAVAYGIGEWAGGAGAHVDRMVCVTLGTGVGSSFLRAGVAVDSGPDVPDHGEVHRLTIDGRPLEETVSSAALRRADREQSGASRTVEQLCAAARAGEPAAVQRDGDGDARTGRGAAPVGRPVRRDAGRGRWLHRPIVGRHRSATRPAACAQAAPTAPSRCSRRRSGHAHRWSVPRSRGRARPGSVAEAGPPHRRLHGAESLSDSPPARPDRVRARRSPAR